MMLIRSIRSNLANSVRQYSMEVETSVVRAAVGGGGGGGEVRGDSLGKRLFKLVYDKRSAVIAIRKWMEEGHRVQKYQLNRIVRELRKLKRNKHALEVCEWMTQQEDMNLLPGDYAIHLDLIAKVRGLNSAKKFFEDLPDKLRGMQTCTSLLHAYVKNKKLAEAEALMEKMAECGFLRNPLPYNHMLHLYIENGQLDKVSGVLKELKRNVKPDIVTYNLLLSVCAIKNNAEKAEEIFMEMKKAKVDPDWVSFSTLTNLYIKAENFDKAASALREMEKTASKRNRSAYASLISSYGNLKDKDAVHRIWNKMKLLFRKMNDAEYLCMVSCVLKLGEFEKAKALYDEWESGTGTRDPRVANILLAAYLNRNEMKEAENFHLRMVKKRIVPCYTTFELLTWGHLKTKEMEKALDYLQKSISSVPKWIPDEKLIKEVCKNLEEQGEAGGAEKLLVVLRDAGYVNTKLYNSLLRTYVKAGKMPLIVEERMRKDNVELDEETYELIRITNNMCVSEVSSYLS